MGAHPVPGAGGAGAGGRGAQGEGGAGGGGGREEAASGEGHAPDYDAYTPTEEDRPRAGREKGEGAADLRGPPPPSVRRAT
ncbi:hypothetical protein GCM10010249_26080 [Streptomyces roseolilacinus]|uniref:Uncharacterized protein n=1 Tax=Streptomyces roseolilacinus TaxID=66904 RepID=A0A918B333_9ACTN|nr:hypothetical protein GCM10010249_26080 [Streptomyces roseolilacinus]